MTWGHNAQSPENVKPDRARSPLLTGDNHLLQIMLGLLGGYALDS